MYFTPVPCLPSHVRLQATESVWHFFVMLARQLIDPSHTSVEEALAAFDAEAGPRSSQALGRGTHLLGRGTHLLCHRPKYPSLGKTGWSYAAELGF